MTPKAPDQGLRFAAVPGDRNSRLAFRAAALTCGFKAPENGPTMANCYTEKMPWRKNDPYPGHISYLIGTINNRNGVLGALKQLWAVDQDRKDTLNAVGLIPARIIHAKTQQELDELAKDAESLIELSMVVFMWLYSHGKLAKEPEPGAATQEENLAIAEIDNLPALIKASKNGEQRKRIAKRMGLMWQPAIAGWLKAFRHNYREQSGEWQGSRKTIKIDRSERGMLPLLIPICKDRKKTQNLIQRWT